MSRPATKTFEEFFKAHKPAQDDPFALPTGVWWITYRMKSLPNRLESTLTANYMEARSKVKGMADGVRSGMILDVHAHFCPLDHDAWEGFAVRIPTDIALVELED